MSAHPPYHRDHLPNPGQPGFVRYRVTEFSTLEQRAIGAFDVHVRLTQAENFPAGKWVDSGECVRITVPRWRHPTRAPRQTFLQESFLIQRPSPQRGMPMTSTK